MCRKFPGRLVVGIDARNGYVATDGWRETSQVEATTLAQELAQEPIAGVVYTDIAKDGMMAGPNLPAMTEMACRVAIPVIASGGVTTVEDVRRLASTGVAGCIIGRALYEGTLTLSDALAAAGPP
jgi:phosphoribosylformimino-5-aminoimidazole carboxamide ribotide isomerase